MQLAYSFPSVDGAYILTQGIHVLPGGLVLVYRVSMESPEAQSPALMAIAVQLCLLTERLHKVHNYRRELIQIAKYYGLYPTTLESEGSRAHRFTDGEASVTLRIAYRKARKPSNP